jgi:hypothetical protein
MVDPPSGSIMVRTPSSPKLRMSLDVRGQMGVEYLLMIVVDGNRAATYLNVSVGAFELHEADSPAFMSAGRKSQTLVMRFVLQAPNIECEAGSGQLTTQFERIDFWPYDHQIGLSYRDLFTTLKFSLFTESTQVKRPSCLSGRTILKAAWMSITNLDVLSLSHPAANRPS